MQLTHLILTPLYPPPRFGGIEKIVKHLAEGLAGIGDRVVVVTFDAVTQDQGGELSNEQVSVRRVSCPTMSGLFHAFIAGQDQLVQTALSSLPCGQQAAVIHAHDWFVAPAAIRLRSCLDAPLLAVFHSDKRAEYGNNALCNDHQRIHLLQRQLAHEADTILCYSNFMRCSIADSTGVSDSKISGFRCGLDEDAFHPMPDRNLRGPILYLGRLAPEKDVPTLIRAFAIVAERQPLPRLRIVGSGSQLARLQQMTAELELTRRVDFVPFTHRQDLVDAELRAASLLVLPSIFEPFGLVVLEAIGRRLPVIVPNVGGPTEIVRHRVTGYQFQPGDVTDLASKISSLLEDSDRASRMAEAALRRTRRIFRWRRAVATVRRTCERLVCAGRSQRANDTERYIVEDQSSPPAYREQNWGIP